MIGTTLAGRPTSRIGLGCGRLVGGASTAMSRKLVEQARHLGISHFDLAPSYGMGLAENVIGEVLEGESGITIATKVGQGRPTNPGLKVVARQFLRPLLAAAPGVKSRLVRQGGKGVTRGQFAPGDVERSFVESLRRLRRDRVDTLLLHQPHPADITEELAVTMCGFVDRGSAGALGSGSGTEREDLARFGAVSQFRLNLNSTAEDGNVILHGAFRHYPKPERVSAEQNSAISELGRDERDPSSWIGIVLTLALAQNPNAIVLVSSNSPERLGRAVKSIDWDRVSTSGESDVAMMRRALALP